MLATITNRSVLENHGISTESIEHLDMPISIITLPQRQGDVFIFPVTQIEEKGQLIPTQGITVVRGESTGGNAHILHTLEGECYWRPASNPSTELVQGYLTVSEGASATLIHTQGHGVLGIGPGCYEVRGQREMAGEWRRVAD